MCQMVLSVILMSFAVSLAAQDNSAALEGKLTLRDRRPGELASSITVVLSRSDSLQIAVRGIVNQDGEFRFHGARPGAHVITASAPGFKTIRLPLDVLEGNRVRGVIRIALEPEEETTRNRGSDIVSQNELNAPRKAVKQVEVAEKALLEGDLIGAASAIEKALKEYPAYSRAWLAKGRLLERQGDVNAAARSFQTAIDRDANCYSAYSAWAEMLRLKGATQELRTLSDLWKNAQPLDATPYYYSSLAFFAAGDFRAAVKDSLQAAQFPHPHLPHLNLLLANAYLKLKQLPAATAQLEEFLANYPDDPLAPQARSTLETVHRISPP
jgi:tetratricopeptide (TPR) repeat protein